MPEYYGSTTESSAVVMVDYADGSSIALFVVFAYCENAI